MSEEIIVQAEVVTEEPTNQLQVSFKANTIVDNVAELDQWVDKELEPFQGATIDPENSEHVSQARKLCAMLNKIAEPINKKRIEIKKLYSAPLNEFDDRVQAVIRKIKDARADLNDQVKEADAMFKDRRMEFFREEYEGIAGELANVIPLEAIVETEWFQRSKSDVYGAKKLADKAEKALAGYRNLDAQSFNHKAEVLREYCLTLDTQKALSIEADLNLRDEEMAQFQQAQAEAGLIEVPLITRPDSVVMENADLYKFTIQVPLTEFQTTTVEAMALKNHLLKLGIVPQMTKSAEPLEVVNAE